MKYSEMHPLPVEILANKFNNGLIHYKQILSMELDIFSTLSFYVSFPTSYELLSFYLASLTKSLVYIYIYISLAARYDGIPT